MINKKEMKNGKINCKTGMAIVLASLMLSQGALAASVYADEPAVQTEASAEVMGVNDAAPAPVTVTAVPEMSVAAADVPAAETPASETSAPAAQTPVTPSSTAQGTKTVKNDSTDKKTDSVTDLKTQLPVELKTEQVKNTLTEGTSLEVKLQVTNKSSKDMTDLTFDIDSGLSNLSVGDLSKVVIDSLKAGESKTITIPVTVESTIASSTTGASLIVRCNFSCENQKYTGRKKAGLTLVNTASESTDREVKDSENTGIGSGVYSAADDGFSADACGYSSDSAGAFTTSAPTTASKTPTLLVKSYNIGGTVRTGDVFNFTMQLLNTSSNHAIENAVITMEPSDGIALQNSSNIIYIDNLAAGQTSDQTISLKALADAKNENQKLTLTIKYEYVDNNERKTAESTVHLSFPVEQKDRMEFRDATYDDEMQVDKEGTISIPVVNKGRGDIYNVEATLNLDHAKIEQKTVYSGNYESGKNGTIDFIVTPSEEGASTGTVHVTYENKDGESKSVDIPISYTAKAAVVPAESIPTETSDETPDESSGFAVKIGVPAGIGAVLAALAVFFFKKRKKNKAEIAGEDDLDGWGAEA